MPSGARFCGRMLCMITSAVAITACSALLRRRRLQLQHDAFLAAVGAKKHGGHARFPPGAGVASGIPVGRLDLDELGAVVRQHLWLASGPKIRVDRPRIRSPVSGFMMR